MSILVAAMALTACWDPNEESALAPQTTPAAVVAVAAPPTPAPVVATIPAPAPTPGVLRGGLELTIESLRSDMSGLHEATIVGIVPSWSWGRAPDRGFGLTGYPSSWTSPAYTMWGIVGPAPNSPPTNARVQIRHLRTDFKRGGRWYRAQSERTGIGGSQYTNFSTNASYPADVVSLGNEGIAVKPIHSGGTFHFYPSNRVPYPRDAQALVVSMDVRLVKDNPNGADDLDNARIYGVAAGDIYQSMNAQWNATNWVNGHAPIGRFRQIDRNWRTISAHLGLSSDADFADYVAWVSTLPR